MRIVIGGRDEIAYRLAESLMSDHEVVLVLPEGAQDARAESLDAQIVYGSQSGPNVLRRAGVEGTDAFVACSENNEQNLVACVTAKQVGAERTLCFLLRRDFHSTLDDDDALRTSLGIDELVRPPALLAEEIVRIVTVPGALDVETFFGGRVGLLRHPVEPGAPITDGSLRELGVPDGIVLVMARRGEEVFIPSGNTVFEPGDKLTAMGTTPALNRLLFSYLRSRDHGRDARAATVVGGGIVGLGVARGLERSGWSVKLIESNRERCEDIAPMIGGLVLEGDGSDLRLMEEEQVANDAVLVAVTSNDEKNLLISLLAKQLGVPRIVTRADNPANERLFERVGVDVVRSASGAAIRAAMRWALADEQEERLAELEHGDAEVLELELPAALRPVALRHLKAPLFAIVGVIVRGDEVIVPRGDDTIEGGDHVVVFCLKQDEAEARQFFLEKLIQGQE